MIRLLLESDLLVAYLKKEDRLKSTAVKVITDVEAGKLGQVQASTEVLHELYYVFADAAPVAVILADEAKITTIQNLIFLAPGFEEYLLALNLMETQPLPSIFDALYAATALSPRVPDHTILSTDATFDGIKGLKRVDPRTL